MEQAKVVIKYLHAGVFLVIDGGFSSLSNGEKGFPACIFKRQPSFQYIFKTLYFFFLGTITLKAIFHYFQHYLFKKYKSINEHFEKPTPLFFSRYPVMPLALHIAQWRSANEAESLLHLHYAQIKRNPE